MSCFHPPSISSEWNLHLNLSLEFQITHTSIKMNNLDLDIFLIFLKH
jgi:hypothetical protein